VLDIYEGCELHCGEYCNKYIQQMDTCQAPTLANIMLRNETWLPNLIMFTHYASWIYGRSLNGFYAHAKTKCLL
jgi:hypothetical protein